MRYIINTAEGRREVTREEWLRECLGDEVGRICIEGGYAFSALDDALRWAPGARGTELRLDEALPLGDPLRRRQEGGDGLSQVVHDPGSLAIPDPTWFLVHHSGGERKEEYRAAYDALRDELAPAGRVSDYAGLCALRDALVRQLAREEGVVLRALRAFRAAFAVLYVEGNYQLDQHPPADQELRRQWSGFLMHAWSTILLGHSAEWAGARIRGLTDWFDRLHTALVELQAAAIEHHLAWRDEIISDVLPLEFRRHACESILSKALRGEAVEVWGTPEEEQLQRQQPVKEKSLGEILSSTPDLMEYAGRLYYDEDHTLPAVWRRVEAEASGVVTLPITSEASFKDAFYKFHRGKRKGEQS